MSADETPHDETPSTEGALTQGALLSWLEPIQDPDLGMGLVELGMIYECEPSPDGKVDVKMTLTSPACPAAGYLMDQVKKRLLEHPRVKEANVALVFEPKWDPKLMASDEVKDKLGIW